MSDLLECQLGCPIPVADDPDRVVIPEGRTPDETLKNLTYITEDEFADTGSPLFGGHLNWSQREESFKLKPEMKVNLRSLWVFHFFLV